MKVYMSEMYDVMPEYIKKHNKICKSDPLAEALKEAEAGGYHE